MCHPPSPRRAARRLPRRAQVRRGRGGARPLRATHRVLDIDGARVDKGDGAWGLCRASNTQPVLVLRFEAKSERAATRSARRWSGGEARHRRVFDSSAGRRRRAQAAPGKAP
ncbi:MAG: hypothetical protein WKG00_16700 [Polyangiaceae bacterium]